LQGGAHLPSRAEAARLHRFLSRDFLCKSRCCPCSSASKGNLWVCSFQLATIATLQVWKKGEKLLGKSEISKGNPDAHSDILLHRQSAQLDA
jgi:hypothetical protein